MQITIFFAYLLTVDFHLFLKWQQLRGKKSHYLRAHRTGISPLTTSLVKCMSPFIVSLSLKCQHRTSLWAFLQNMHLLGWPQLAYGDCLSHSTTHDRAATLSVTRSVPVTARPQTVPGPRLVRASITHLSLHDCALSACLARSDWAIKSPSLWLSSSLLIA